MNKLIAWVEIPVLDMHRAVDFYNAVFKLSLKAMDFGNEKMAFFPNDEGALSQAKNFNPSKDGVLASFNVADSMESTIEHIIERNGTIVFPKTKIEAEGRGYFAIFIDSEGNKIGLYSQN
ncbi:VOC family protein [Carboxylicivirga sediminis]|uniref:VOC family protein n=1 Tax=Carboxylicivirga sediminis TaxID=2006564 RepID=A0A941F444_9BACT|nr:VOC family protein [Carboxylicivirga sediminis]MBR8535315.1 VOC family protein [Carboxylicivirga sediminis]